jgi:hypothetical protein
MSDPQPEGAAPATLREGQRFVTEEGLVIVQTDDLVDEDTMPDFEKNDVAPQPPDGQES